ncbi:MAG: oligosaccharide flippase family protein [Pelagibacterales bacterium]|nr:oligosaccharide flippase family protein [Pelagibacterales bacterium]
MNFKEKIFGHKDLLSIGTANLFGSGISAIFWFSLASLINPEEYGQIHYFLAIAGMAQLLSLISTTNALQVYVAKNIKIHSTLFFISIIAGIVSSLVVFLFFSRTDTSLLVLGYIIFELSNGFLLGKKLFSNYAKFFLTQKILTVIFGFGLYFTFGVDGIIFGLVLSYVPYIWILVNEFRNTRIDFSLLKPRKGFLINNYGINISSAVGGQMDKLIIAPILGLELLGNYSLAMQFLVILLLLPTTVFKYLLTQDSSGKNTKNLKKNTIFASVGLTMFGIVILPMIIPILFPNYIDTVIAIQIISVAIIPSTIGIFYDSKLLSIEKSKFLVIGKGIGLFTMISGFVILGPIYGIIGLAVTLVVSSCLQTLVVIIASKTIRYEEKH